MINVMAEKTEPFNWVRISAKAACDDLNIMPWLKAWNPYTTSSAFPENGEIEMAKWQKYFDFQLRALILM